MSLTQRGERRLRTVITWLDQPGFWVGRLAAWLIVPLIGVLAYEVISRYGFNRPTLWAYDITYMLYGTLFMLGAAYALGRDAHVRADFLFNVLTPRTQGLMDGVFTLFLFFPAISFFTFATFDYAVDSWAIGERIITSPWMPVIYPLKTVMPVTGVLLLIQGVSELLKNAYAVLTNRPFREAMQ